MGLTCRSRPINLRQRPRARYNEDLEDLGLSSDDEPKPKPKKRQWTVVSESSGESDQEEAAEKPEDESNAAEGEDEGVASNSPLPVQPESLTRAQQKNPRAKRGGKKACLLSHSFLLLVIAVTEVTISCHHCSYYFMFVCTLTDYQSS